MANTLPLDLYVDTVNKRIIPGGIFTPSPENFSPLYQYVTYNMRVWLVKPDRVNGGWLQVDPTLLGLWIAIGPIGGPPLAQNFTWAKQVGQDAAGLQQYFYGPLNLNTNEMNTAIGSEDFIQPRLEVLTNEAGAYLPVYQETIAVEGVVINPGGAIVMPTPSPEFLTTEQMDERYIKWQNNPAGRALTFISPDGATSRTIGVRNDKSPEDDIV